VKEGYKESEEITVDSKGSEDSRPETISKVLAESSKKLGTGEQQGRKDEHADHNLGCAELPFPSQGETEAADIKNSGDPMNEAGEGMNTEELIKGGLKADPKGGMIAAGGMREADKEMEEKATNLVHKYSTLNRTGKTGAEQGGKKNNKSINE
jgi:hypothetical protein